MSDPLEVLRAPLTPIDPDPAFAARLRARLEHALRLPRGVAMTATAPRPASTPAPTPPVTGGVTPYIAVADARRALRWYADALGARLVGDPIAMPDGRIGHCEFTLGGGRVYLSDAHPEIGVVAPEPGAGAAVTLHAEVADVDAVTTRAVEAGAVLERAPQDNPYGRIAVVRDPFGHRWMLATVPAAPAAEPMRAGDFAYVSLWVPDVARAADFFAAALGWDYEDPAAPDRRRLVGSTPSHGLFAGQGHGTLFACFAVSDIAAAVERVRAAGGVAGEPTEAPHGVVADCTDDQGVAFALYQLTGTEVRPAPNGTRHGDLAYVTMEVVDAERAREFYGAVLGWRFARGHAPDGWQVEGTAPMAGIGGGAERATVVPMYRVVRIDEAVERIRAAGGTATDPERQPYGVTAECTDDQGTRFWVGEL